MGFCRRLTAAAVLVLWVLPGTGLARDARELKASTSKKCAICHYSWVPAFYVEGRSTPIARFAEKTAKISDWEVCISCHDGSVRDSRRKVCNDPGHRVGRVPTRKVVIPPDYPLDESGALKCTTCHTPHAVTSKSGSMVEYFLRAPNENSSFCRTCHREKLGGLSRGNHPIDVSAQIDPGIILRSGGKFGTEKKNRIICETCHQAHGGVNEKRLVLPVEDTHTMSVLCEVCHTRNATRPGRAASGAFSHPVDVRPGKAAQVPARWSSGREVFLDRGGEVVCRTCHTPHLAADAEYLLADRRGRDAMCVQCHPRQAPVSGTSHDLRATVPAEKNNAMQEAAAGGPCSPCHLVHGGTDVRMWARGRASGPDGSCRSCHAPGQCAEEKQPSGPAHPLQVTLAGSSGEVPLYDKKGNRRFRDGQVACMSCHDVHNPAPVYASEGAEGIIRGRFLRMGDQGASAHCMQCHSEQASVAGTAHDLRSGAGDFKNLIGQAPAQSGVCSPCHAAHNAPQQAYLWAAPRDELLPPVWLAAQPAPVGMIESMCAGCHGKRGMAKDLVPDFGLHPREFFGTAASAGSDVNPMAVCLYEVSGACTDSGGIACATCHDAHRRDPRGAGGRGMAGKFLKPGLAEGFCKFCHGEEALIRFLYYHKKSAR